MLEPTVTVPEESVPESDTPEIIPKADSPTEDHENKENRTEDESHTPPLPPDMKLKLFGSDKKSDSKSKTDNKNNNWDMFAEQDIFKNDYNVRKTKKKCLAKILANVIFSLLVKCL